MKKISELVQTENIFPDAVRVEKADDLIGHELVFLAVAERKGDENDYLVVKAVDRDIEISFSCGGKAFVRKLMSVVNAFQLAPDPKTEVYTFPEPVQAKMVKVLSKASGYKYINLVDWDGNAAEEKV